jgi:hypothetical protein
MVSVFCQYVAPSGTSMLQYFGMDRMYRDEQAARNVPRFLSVTFHAVKSGHTVLELSKI